MCGCAVELGLQLGGRGHVFDIKVAEGAVRSFLSAVSRDINQTKSRKNKTIKPRFLRDV